MRTQYTLSELVHGLEVTLKGDPTCVIEGVSPIQQAQPGHVTFLTNRLYSKHLASTQAAAVILSAADAEHCPVNAIISSNPYYTYSQIAAFFTHPTAVEAGVHPSAIIGNDSAIDPSASIGAHCVIGRHVKIGANVVIGPGCVVGDFSEIGEATQLDAKVTVYHRIKIGKRVRMASGVVIGGDGFGFANQKGVWHKVPQLGSVEIGDDVDIGANTTIDRGAIENTVIENGVKLDNLVQIGHNVKIGANTLICGCTGVAGSTVIGKNCIIAGASNINGHITITDNVIITGNTGVEKSITEPGIYSSGVVGVVTNQEFRKNNARFYRLENLMHRVKTLESTLKMLTEGKAS
ncbi:MAG: UDP-3-O-(3-hydroxymyristoyl)glucosamine N-acyltransferase [Gammaproteobacteria bacterium]|nr:MAG: UDP-3-O-(3-hydroxymyristoyl)glucosamine N-acyltransferase [Gammaproteobacteria bacterium]